MAKRRKAEQGGSFTGGTGDVKPQWLTVEVPRGSAIDEYGVVRFILPQLVLGGANDSTIVEILRVDWYLGLLDSFDVNVLFWGFLTTITNRTIDDAASVTTLEQDVGRPSTFACAILNNKGIGASGLGSSSSPISVDMTDGNGNGILVASQQLFAVSGSLINTIPSIAVAKILYRMVNVKIEEYVGIVASQTTG